MLPFLGHLSNLSSCGSPLEEARRGTKERDQEFQSRRADGSYVEVVCNVCFVVHGGVEGV